MSADDDTAASPTDNHVTPTDLREARTLVKAMILRIAPNLDADELDRFESLHDVGDFDSLDFVNLMSVTTELTGIEIPARDYPLVITIESFATYLLNHSSSS